MPHEARIIQFPHQGKEPIAPSVSSIETPPEFAESGGGLTVAKLTKTAFHMLWEGARLGADVSSGIADIERAGLELMQLLRSDTYNGPSARLHLKDKAVMSVPGFLMGDRHDVFLQNWLHKEGYRNVQSGIHLNVRSVRHHMDGVERRLAEESDRTGRKTTMIGISLGGNYAFSVGMAFPQYVDRVVTLGAPLTKDPRSRARLPVGIMSKFFLDVHDEDIQLMNAQLEEPLPSGLELFVIQPRHDGVIHQNFQTHPEAMQIRAGRSHIGMPMSAPVFKEIGEILAGAYSPQPQNS